MTADISATDFLLSRVNADVAAISHLVREKRVRFLCGAGMSKAAGYSLASDLAQKMVADIVGVDVSTLGSDFSRRYPFEAVASAYVEARDRQRLRDLLRTEFSQNPAQLHDGHHALDYFASHGYIDRVYTTNFDSLLEEGLGERAEAVTDIDPEAISRALQSRKVPVLHLHGTVETRTLITEKETYSLDTPLARIMASDMMTHHFVWIGYSMGDVDLRSLYLATRELLIRDDLVKRSYFVYPVSEATVAYEVRLADLVWQARGASFIPAGAAEFLAKLVKHVRQARGEELARELAKRQGRDPGDPRQLAEVWEAAEETRRDLRLNDPVDGLVFLAQKHGLVVDDL